MRREIYENGELVNVVEEPDSPQDIKFKQALARLKTAYRFQGTPTNAQIASTLKDLMFVLRYFIRIDDDTD
jgi:hypothetical protein